MKALGTKYSYKTISLVVLLLAATLIIVANYQTLSELITGDTVYRDQSLVSKDTYYEMRYESSTPGSGAVAAYVHKNEPKVTLSRWNDEEQLSVGFAGVASPGAREQTANIVKWKDDDIEMHAYPLPVTEQMEDGGFEIELQLNRPPVTNTFAFYLEDYEDLEFRYQGPLNEEPHAGEICSATECIDEDTGEVTRMRPFNVAGSYAVYHKEKRDFRPGQTNYATGKMYHIYRPHMVDAAGRDVWGEIAYRDGALYVTVPQDFLDTATYPVLVDPTFGFSSVGGSTVSIKDRVGFEYAAPTTGGTLDSITAYIGSAGPQNAIMALYESTSATDVGSLLGNTTAIAVSASAGAWRTASTWSGSAPTVTASTNYFIAMFGSANVGTYAVAFDNGGITNAAYVDATYPTLPDPPTSETSLAIDASIYATYTEDAADPTAFTQSNWRWYENTNNIQPSTPLAAEKATTTGASVGDILRLRMNVEIGTTTLDADSQAFRLQYAEATQCSAATGWRDVSAVSSGLTLQHWVQATNTTPTDGSTISSVLLTDSDITATYETANPTALNPATTTIAEKLEWDFVLKNNAASANSTYCFRMVLDDHTELDTYAANSYPVVTTGNSNVTQASYRWRNDDGGEGSVTEFLTGGASSTNPSANTTEYVFASAQDDDYLYVAGRDNTSGDERWRIEKREKGSGALVTAFGTDGVVTVNPSANTDKLLDIQIDDTHIYVAGLDGTSADGRWRLEKRDKTTGALDTDFDTDGIITVNPTANNEDAVFIKVHDEYVYLAGVAFPSGGNRNWRIEKRNKNTGALVSGFGTSGVLELTISGGLDIVYDIEADDAFIYVVGTDEVNLADRQWRVEKRDSTTGALAAGFGTSGVVTSNKTVGQTDEIQGVAIDDGYIYIVGEARDQTSPSVNYSAHIEKRNIVTGALCASASDCADGEFASGGISVNNEGDNHDNFVAVQIDEEYIYVVGLHEAGETDQGFFAQKRNRITGDLCSSTSTCRDGEYGTGGKLTFNPSAGWDMFYSALLDDQYIYKFGRQETTSSDQGWYMEKRTATDGVLVSGTTSSATWADTEDTASTFSKGSTTRLRVAVSNTDNTAKDYAFRLQYADKGIAATCEVVAGGSFSDVPVASSCGSDGVCMATSTVADGVRTTPQLTAATSRFKPGYIVSGSSNQSATTTLFTGQYTEFEYVIRLTDNASAGGSYCFRLANQTTALDTYTNVAELGVEAEAGITTLTAATSSDPTSFTIAPGSSATTTNAFALVGTAADTITTITLAHQNASSTSLIEIFSDAGGGVVFGSTTTAVGTSTTITLDTTISVTTSTTTYKIRMTPKTQADLPSGNRGELIVFNATVLDFTGGNTATGTDQAFPVIIDNQSLPAFGTENASSSFATKADYAAGVNPESVTAADLNNDGHIDLAVASRISARVSVFINEGDGTYAAKVDYITGSSPRSLTAADLNNDGHMDLAVTNYGSASVSVFLNQGDGTYAAKVDYTTGSQPRSVTAADLNNDGYVDLAVANITPNSVSVLLNEGDGTYAAKVDYTTDTNPFSVTAADFNNDGYVDLATANNFLNTTSVFLNNGDGTYADKVDYTTGSTPLSVTAADLNNDGYVDLATANSDSDSVSVFLNEGDGTYAAKVDYTTGSSPYSVTAGDLNNDGQVDLVVANSASSSVSIFLGNGDGTYAAKVDYTTGSDPQSVTGADLNNDGHLDLAVANYNSNSVSVFLNNATTTLTATTTGAGSGEVIVNYTTPPQEDIDSIIILASTSPVTTAPTDGTTYTGGEDIGGASVACVDSSVATSTADSCTATSLTPGTPYYFSVFVKDASGNYSFDVEPIDSPATPLGVVISGVMTIANHIAGQVSNAFNFMNKINESLFAFRLTPTSTATTTELVVALSGIDEVDSADFSNIRLYEDVDDDALYDASDVELGTGVMSISGQTGTITFSTDFSVANTTDYVVIADWNVPNRGAMLKLDLLQSGLTVIDDAGSFSIDGDVNSIQHIRNNSGGGGGSSSRATGGSAPAGDGVVTGGGAGGGGAVDTNAGGDTIGNEAGFRWPASSSGSWSSLASAYDQTDGTYATTTTAVSATFSNFSFNMAGASSVKGIAVKLELSGTTAAGTVSVDLSWDGGTSWTSTKVSPTITTTDTVITLGDDTDLWGQDVWSLNEVANENFRVRITGAPSSNTIQLDAIQVRVYPNVGGGGSGGGGRI